MNNYETIKQTLLMANSVSGFLGAAEAMLALEVMQAELAASRCAANAEVAIAMAHSDSGSYAITATDASDNVVQTATFAPGDVRGLAGLRFAASWVAKGRPVIDAGGTVAITKAQPPEKPHQ